MPKGNPNPSPSTRFKPGQSGNPGGKTDGQRAAEIEAARIASELRLTALSSLQEIVESGDMTVEEIHKALVSSENLKLFKDSEDRAHGTPKSTNEHGGIGGGSIPVTEVRYRIIDPVKDGD